MYHSFLFKIKRKPIKSGKKMFKSVSLRNNQRISTFDINNGYSFFKCLTCLFLVLLSGSAFGNPTNQNEDC